MEYIVTMPEFLYPQSSLPGSSRTIGKGAMMGEDPGIEKNPTCGRLRGFDMVV